MDADDRISRQKMKTVFNNHVPYAQEDRGKIDYVK